MKRRPVAKRATPRRPSRRQASAQARRTRKIFIFVVLLIAGVVTVAAVTGDRGYLDVRRQRARMQELQAEVSALNMENVALLEQVRALRKDPYTVEKIAREKLGYARPGEIIFRFPPDQPAVPADTPPPTPQARRD